jgi:DNA (cytosine-5)-methyltransferase 1
MIYGSVCSGIEAASCAWHPLGWKAAFLSEIEPFPRSVLQHHYPDVPLHGDFTTIQRTGCMSQLSFLSEERHANRSQLQDSEGGWQITVATWRSNFFVLLTAYRPKWIVWENVPGVLSSNGGRDFGSILGGLVELGYGIAYRVLDAQFFGVPQRRRRVFVVGCLGDWRGAASGTF